MVQQWLERPNTAILAPTERHWPILQALIPKAQVRGPLMMDAHLVALAIEHGAVIYTSDRDFSRFPVLKWVNPLEASGSGLFAQPGRGPDPLHVFVMVDSHHVAAAHAHQQRDRL